MEKKKYEVTEESESDQEVFIHNRIPHTHCKCHEFVIIIIIIPQRTDSRHWALTSAALGLQTFLYCASHLSLLMFSTQQTVPPDTNLPSQPLSFHSPSSVKLPIQYFLGILLLSFRTT